MELQTFQFAPLLLVSWMQLLLPSLYDIRHHNYMCGSYCCYHCLWSQYTKVRHIPKVRSDDGNDSLGDRRSQWKNEILKIVHQSSFMFDLCVSVCEMCLFSHKRSNECRYMLEY